MMYFNEPNTATQSPYYRDSTVRLVVGKIINIVMFRARTLIH